MNTISTGLPFCDRSTADKPDDYEEEPDDDSGDGGNSEALKKLLMATKSAELLMLLYTLAKQSPYVALSITNQRPSTLN